MPQRFTDRADTKALIRQSVGFRYRSHGISLSRLIAYFLILLFVVIVSLNNLIIKLLFMPDGAEPPAQYINLIMGTTIFSGMAVGGLAVYLIFRIREHITATEFQNLIFANAMRVGSEFCTIIHKKNGGIYTNHEFDKAFKHVDSEDSCTILLESGGLTKKDQEKFKTVVKSGKAVEFPFTMKKPKTRGRKITLKIDPIAKPKGFVVVHGISKK